MLEEIWESPAFWMLGGGAVVAEILGFIMAKGMGWELLPWWQLILLIVGTLVAAAFFALRE
jgi:hypothetical protein